LERYNFATECFDDRDKGIRIVAEMEEFAEHVHLHEFTRIGGQVSYFITGQSIEVDSNAGCWQLRSCMQSHETAAVFINDPFNHGIILKREA
jgi:hypothetical protein